MIEQPHDEHVFQRYLLGELPEEERERLQESYFADAGLFSRLLSAEAELIDSYARGELTAEERRRFEQRFGNIRGVDQRLKFSDTLSRAAERHSVSVTTSRAGRDSRPSPVHTSASSFPWLSSVSPSLGSKLVRGALAAVVAIIVAMTALLVATRWLSQRNAERELTRSSTDSSNGQPISPPNASVPGPTKASENARSAGPATRPDEKRPPSSPREQLASVSVVLREGITRADGQATPVVLLPATKSLQTQLELPSGLQLRMYSSYQAVLQTVSGQEITRRDGLKISKTSGGSFVRLNIPEELLTTRDYVVLLSGQRPDGTNQFLRGYSFTVTRK